MIFYSPIKVLTKWIFYIFSFISFSHIYIYYFGKIVTIATHQKYIFNWKNRFYLTPFLLLVYWFVMLFSFFLYKIHQKWIIKYIIFIPNGIFDLFSCCCNYFSIFKIIKLIKIINNCVEMHDEYWKIMWTRICIKYSF